jgi:hypothetical protein
MLSYLRSINLFIIVSCWVFVGCLLYLLLALNINRVRDFGISIIHEVFIITND